MAGKITLTTFGIGAYGLQSGKIHWMALGCQQWGFLSGGGSSNFTWTYPQSFTSSVYSIQLAMRSGGSTTAFYNAFKTTSYSLTQWQGYMSLKENVSFFLLAIGVQQWGKSLTAESKASVTFPIAFERIVYFVDVFSLDAGRPCLFTKSHPITTNGFYWEYNYHGDDVGVQWLAIGV